MARRNKRKRSSSKSSRPTKRRRSNSGRAARAPRKSAWRTLKTQNVTKRSKLPKVGNLRKEIAVLKKKAIISSKLDNASLSTMINRRYAHSWVFSAAAGLSAQAFFPGSSKSILNDDLAFTRFYNPTTTPPTFATRAAGGAVTGAIKFMFQRITTKITVRNQGLHDAHVKIYRCQNRADTNLDPINIWGDAKTLAAGGNATQVDQLFQYPSDYKPVTDLWNLDMLTAGETKLAPGEAITASYTVNDVDFDPSADETHAFTYQRAYKSMGLLLVGRASQVYEKKDPIPSGAPNIGAALFQVMHEQNAKIIYDGGANQRYFVLTNPIVVFTDTDQAQKPIPGTI